MFIDERNPEYRQEIIEFLEKKGFVLDPNEPRSRDDIIKDRPRLPLVMDTDKKVYRMMGNVTCAAAAAQSGGLRTRDEFYEYWERVEGY